MVTVITKTIGPADRDYATFALAEADTSNIGTSANLVANDEAIVFAADPVTFTSGASLAISNSSLTVDATRNVSYTAATGNPTYVYTGGGNGIRIFDPYTRWSGIDMTASSGTCFQIRANSGYGSAQAGTTVENAVLTASSVAIRCQKFSTGHGLGTSSEPITIRNVVTKSVGAVNQLISGSGHTTGAHLLVVNCTHLGSGTTVGTVWQWGLSGGMPSASAKIINCVNLAQNASDDADITSGGVDVSGSVHNIGNSAAATSSRRFENISGGIGAQFTPTTNTSPGFGNFAIFDATDGRLYNIDENDVWQVGQGPALNSAVPTTDILGASRSGLTANPGAFELGVGETVAPPASPASSSEPNTTPEFRVHLDRRVTDASSGVSSAYDSATNTTTFTLPYKLNDAATMQVVTRKTLTSNAGQSLTVVSTDAANRQVVVSGYHTGTPVFIGEQYTMKYEFSELHLQRGKNTYSAEPITAASHRVRYGRLNYGETAFFSVKVTAKGNTPNTYVFNGNLLNEPETQLGSIGLYDGHFQFPVMSDHDRVTIELENDSPLPSRFLSCEWESFYHSRINLRSRF